MTDDAATDQTTIAVALCTYNGERHLPQLLESLLSQERVPDELVASDDCSTDGTVALLERFATHAPFRVRINRNNRNVGATANFEYAIGMCESDLIAPCDQDDIWQPKKLLRAAEAFEADPELGFVFSDADLVDERLHPLDKRLWDAVAFSPERRRSAARGGLLQLMVLYTFVTGAAMTFRSDLRSLILPIPHGWVHDAWISLIAAFVRPYRMLDEPLLRYRLHEGQEIGVPPAVMPDETPLQRWRTRLRSAPEKVALRKADVHRQRRRAQAMLYDAVVERIEAQAEVYIQRFGGSWQPSADEVLDDVKERARHLHVRGELPDQRARRVRHIAAELRSGRYGRYSAGVLSALQDVLS